MKICSSSIEGENNRYWFAASTSQSAIITLSESVAKAAQILDLPVPPFPLIIAICFMLIINQFYNFSLTSVLIVLFILSERSVNMSL